MTDAPSHRQFFGDAERDFELPPSMILELERLTGAGIGALLQRLVRHEFKLIEITETIRLAMIGGGTAPEEAAALIAAYIPMRPLEEAHLLALTILEKRWFGEGASWSAPADDDREEPAPRKRTSSSRSSPPETDETEIQP